MCQVEDIVIHATWQRYGNVFCFNLYIDFWSPFSIKGLSGFSTVNLNAILFKLFLDGFEISMF
jgi:hypothetical protein